MKAKMPKGCQTGKTLFYGLGVIIGLKINQYFRDDGYVKDFRGWERDIFVKEFGRRPHYKRERPSFYHGLKGFCVPEDVDNKEFAFIAYRPDHRGPRYEGAIRVHEEVHAMINFNKEEQLNLLMRKRGVPDFDSAGHGEKRGEEIVANIVEVHHVNSVLGISKKEMLSFGKEWRRAPAAIKRLEKAGYVFT